MHRGNRGMGARDWYVIAIAYKILPRVTAASWGLKISKCSVANPGAKKNLPKFMHTKHVLRLDVIQPIIG